MELRRRALDISSSTHEYALIRWMGSWKVGTDSTSAPIWPTHTPTVLWAVLLTPLSRCLPFSWSCMFFFLGKLFGNLLSFFMISLFFFFLPLRLVFKVCVYKAKTKGRNTLSVETYFTIHHDNISKELTLIELSYGLRELILIDIYIYIYI